MKKFLQGFCFVVALVFVLFVYQSVNANVVKGHVEKVQGRTCSCGGTLVVRSKIVTKPGPDDCYHCHGNGYNIINNTTVPFRNLPVRIGSAYSNRLTLSREQSC